MKLSARGIILPCAYHTHYNETSFMTRDTRNFALATREMSFAMAWQA